MVVVVEGGGGGGLKWVSLSVLMFIVRVQCATRSAALTGLWVECLFMATDECRASGCGTSAVLWQWAECRFMAMDECRSSGGWVECRFMATD